ncbi:MAG: hypothetical protein NTW27_10415 [Deltaproteobacteria bacterium]|nr:hypothetical protein [Deltaproteobacteria bacterium]
MSNIAKIVICGFLIAAIAAPVFAAGNAKKPYSLSNITGTIYQGSATALDKTEGVFSGVLKRTFGFFNPCLDLVKGCANVVLTPIEKPVAYLESTVLKRKVPGASKVPAPKKPEISK